MIVNNKHADSSANVGKGTGADFSPIGQIKFVDPFGPFCPIEWDSEYSIGVPELDSQHKELLGFFNDAISKTSGDKTEERKYFNSIKETFISFIEKHFRTEEQFLFLSSGNYTRYDEHILEHIKLLEKINLIKREIENGKWEMNLFILTITLKNMFMYHLKSYDIDAKECFAKNTGTKTRIVETAEAEYYAFQN